MRLRVIANVTLKLIEDARHVSTTKVTGGEVMQNEALPYLLQAMCDQKSRDACEDLSVRSHRRLYHAASNRNGG
jgi:hypothetical protein